MPRPEGYKAHRPSVAQRVQEARLKEVAKMDVPLLWLPSWDVQLTAAQRYKLARGLV